MKPFIAEFLMDSICLLLGFILWGLITITFNI